MPKRRLFATLLLAATPLLASAQAAQSETRTAIFAGGCFWCVESDYDKVTGVLSTTSGYIGGKAETANYKSVTKGGTGHREAVKIVYDPKKVSYKRLVYIFWRSVDPTDNGGQFCDRGGSYKTGIYTLDQNQRKTALESRKEAQQALGKTIVTPVVAAGKFYAAEGYHQDYYTKNPVRYKLYRYGCGRDQKIRALWGGQAFAGITH